MVEGVSTKCVLQHRVIACSCLVPSRLRLPSLAHYTHTHTHPAASNANHPLRCVAPGMLEGDDPREALDGFRQVVSMEQDKGEW